ncbi:hypothetical protein Nepgr_002686 [Nepenthes gracilis]|uniref:Uncharacterized protein n=1 Tax=Nepenthes gracilis TaxID=150966 RepID=A0AAD3PA86_NEPGR|nr:hypothetical protein Nepgr_002686 [Nepenthes gracilis]
MFLIAKSNFILGLTNLNVDIDREQHNEASGVHLTCLGWPVPGSDHGVALVGPEASLFLGDQAAENKPLKEDIREAKELLNSIPSHADCLGHAPDLVVNDQRTPIGNQDIQNPLVTRIHTPCSCQQDDPGSAPRQPAVIGDQAAQAQLVAGVPSCGEHHLEDIHKEWHHVSYAEVLRHRITAAGDGIPGVGAAPIPLRPITDADRLDALRISNCPEEFVGTPAFSSSVHAVLSYPQGGDPRPCTHSEQQRRNLADMRQQLAGLGGFGLKSILKKLKRPKQKRSPSSTHHV